MKNTRANPILNWQTFLLLAVSALSITGIDATNQKEIARNKMNSKAEFSSLLDPAVEKSHKAREFRAERINSEDPNTSL